MTDTQPLKVGERIRVSAEYTVAHVYDDGVILTDTGRVMYPSQLSTAEVVAGRSAPVVTDTPRDAETTTALLARLLGNLPRTWDPEDEFYFVDESSAAWLLAALSGAGMVVLDPNNLPDWLTELVLGSHHDSCFTQHGDAGCLNYCRTVPESIRRSAGVL